MFIIFVMSYLIVDILLTFEMEFRTSRNLTLDRSVEQLVLFTQNTSESFECLLRLVGSNMAGHAHLSASKLPDMEVVVLADGVARFKNVLL